MGKEEWVRNEWSVKQLQGKTVEFGLPHSEGAHVEGNGTFVARQRPDGKICVRIGVDRQGKNWAERNVTLFFLPQPAVDAIKQNPNGTNYDFS